MPCRAVATLRWGDPYPTGLEYVAAMEAARIWNESRPVPWEWCLMCNHCRIQGAIGKETGPHGVVVVCERCGREWWVKKSRS